MKFEARNRHGCHSGGVGGMSQGFQASKILRDFTNTNVTVLLG